MCSREEEVGKGHELGEPLVCATLIGRQWSAGPVSRGCLGFDGQRLVPLRVSPSDGVQIRCSDFWPSDFC